MEDFSKHFAEGFLEELGLLILKEILEEIVGVLLKGFLENFQFLSLDEFLKETLEKIFRILEEFPKEFFLFMKSLTKYLNLKKSVEDLINENP